MTEHEIVRTVLSLTNFRVPDGVDYLVLLAPRPGDCQVAVAFTANGHKTHRIELSEPPDESTMLALYRYAESVRDVKNGTHGEHASERWAYTVGVDLNRIGGD